MSPALCFPRPARASSHRLVVAAVAVTLLSSTVAPTGRTDATEFASTTCGGRAATMRGTDRDDRLVGTSADDVIVAAAGNDTVLGLGGHDVICAGPGDDAVSGGDGSDQLFGDVGTDVLRGQAGRADRCWDGEVTSGCETIATSPPPATTAPTATMAPTTTTTATTTATTTTAPPSTAPATTTTPATTTPATTTPATTAPAQTSGPGTFSDGFVDLSKWSMLANWSVQDQSSQSPNSSATVQSGVARIVAADQNYGDAFIRADTKYTLQSGTTVFKMDVDLGSGAQGSDSTLLGWPVARFTALPYGTATTFAGNGKGPTPATGVLVRFVNNCRIPWAPPSVATFTAHTESLSDDTDSCDQVPTLQNGSLNRVEIRYTPGTISIWASDFSADGTTFGPLKHVADYPATLPATGYFAIGAHNHATLKYSNGSMATIETHFDNISYPTAGVTRSYRNGTSADPTGAATAHVSFSAYSPNRPSNPTITVNGRTHPITVTESESHSYAEAIEVPTTDLVAGNNVITVSGFARTGNIDLVVSAAAATPQPPVTTAPATTTPATTTPTQPPATTAPAPATTVPATTGPPTTAPATTTPPTTAPATTAPAVGSGGFFEDFTTTAGKSRFDYQLHTSMNGGPTSITSTFMGEHDHNCNGPTTYRPITGGQSAPTFIDVSNSELIWHCAPGNDPAKGHLMTALDTTDIATLSFSPKQTFNNVTRVCWDQNMNNLGEGKWVNIFIVPANDITRYSGNLNYAAATGLAFGGITQLLPPNAYDFTWLRGTTFVNGTEMMWASNDHGIAPTSPPRFQICLQNSGQQLVIRRPDGTTDTINTGRSFPTGPAKVIFQDASYNPTKHNGSESALTWHWDNITVNAN